MNAPNIGELWRPTGAMWRGVAVLYVCVDILKHDEDNPATTIFKFERLDDGLRIKRNIKELADRWEFIQ